MIPNAAPTPLQAYMESLATKSAQLKLREQEYRKAADNLREAQLDLKPDFIVEGQYEERIGFTVGEVGKQVSEMLGVDNPWWMLGELLRHVGWLTASEENDQWTVRLPHDFVVDVVESL